ncbi:class II aldolase/adducin domain-containing protein [Ramaria rubella]|nr:class II aldolase/adducin domain-containing protein [Ramaria rubella]
MGPIATLESSLVGSLASVAQTELKAQKSAPSVTTSPAAFADKYQRRSYLKERLALALRIFGYLGYDEGVAGHITVRDPVDPACFWVNPFGMHFTLIKASDLILVSHSGEILDGGANRMLNKAAFMIHSMLHLKRPDILCAAHSHTTYGKAFSTLSRPLDITNRDSCAFYDDHVVHTQFKGVVLDEEEGRLIAESLGNKKAAILRNHGLLVATSSIEATIFFFKCLEQVCRVQLMADANASGTVPQRIPEQEAIRIRDEVGSLEYGRRRGLAMFEAVRITETNLKRS